MISETSSPPRSGRRNELRATGEVRRGMAGARGDALRIAPDVGLAIVSEGRRGQGQRRSPAETTCWLVELAVRARARRLHGAATGPCPELDLLELMGEVLDGAWGNGPVAGADDRIFGSGVAVLLQVGPYAVLADVGACATHLVRGLTLRGLPPASDRRSPRGPLRMVVLRHEPGDVFLLSSRGIYRSLGPDELLRAALVVDPTLTHRLLIEASSRAARELDATIVRVDAPA